MCISKPARILRSVPTLILMLMSGSVFADYTLNMPKGVTEISREVYDLHMLIFGVCVVIAIVVFGAMIVSIFLHRKSKGVQPAHFHHNTTVEVIWTIIPFVILVAMAIPAARTLIKMEDFRNTDMSVKITGYQWKWHYEYLDEGIGFFSNLSASSNLARQLNSGIDPTTVENYLLDVDNRLVLPINKRIKILITSNDVIHSWWVPALAAKKDAVPGFVNELWFEIEEPGVYRGQCAELCGRDHGFMPVVVEALTEEDYTAWVAAQGGGAAAASGGQVAQAGAAVDEDKEWSKDELMARGEEVYNVMCAACHQINGEGLAAAGFPPLKGSVLATSDLAAHIDQVLNGKPGTAMAAFGSQLSDLEVAAVVTYERNAWGNDTGDVVQPADIKAAR